MTTSRSQLPRATRSLDPYSVLGVTRDASTADLVRARRRLAKRYHPDLHPGPDASERMRRINEAFDLLASADRRARYDATTQRPTWVTPQRRARPTAQRSASRDSHASDTDAPTTGPWTTSQQTARRPAPSTARWAVPGARPLPTADPVPGADLGALAVATFALVLFVSGCVGSVFRAALAG